MEPHIGMKVWAFDPNRRVYKRDEKGRSVGGPIWREHWVEMEIVGETSRSWLVGPQWAKTHPKQATKIAKREWPGRFAISQDEIDRRAFVEARHVLARRVYDCRDYETLKAIETALDAERTATKE